MPIATVTRAMKNHGPESNRMFFLSPGSVGRPRHPQKRQAHARQSHIQCYLSLFGSNPARRVKQLQLSGCLQLRILLGGWSLRRPHLLPDGVGVAVMIVDAVVLQEDAMNRERNGFHRDRDGSSGRGDVVIMIIPDQYGSLAGGAGG